MSIKLPTPYRYSLNSIKARELTSIEAVVIILGHIRSQPPSVRARWASKKNDSEVTRQAKRETVRRWLEEAAVQTA